MNRVSFAARTLVGPWTMVVVAGINIGTALMLGAPYRGEGMWTVRWMALDQWISWILIAAAAAVDAARLSRPGNTHLPLAAARGRAIYPRAAAWAALPAIAAHTVVIGVALAWGGVTHPRGGWPIILLAVAAQGVTFAWFAALGSLVGRHLPTVWAGIAAAVAAFGAEQLLSSMNMAEPSFTVLGDTGASVSQIGLAWNPVHLAAQILVLSITAVVMVLPRARIGRSGWPTPTRWTAVCTLAVLAVMVFVPQVVPGAPLLARPQAPSSCLGNAPVVCIFPEHERNAEEVITTIRGLADAATAAGYAFMPERLEEASRRYQPGTGVGWIYPIEPGPVDLQLITDGILSANCPVLEDHLPDAYVRNLQRMQDTWLGLYDPTWVPLVPDAGALTPEQVLEIRTDFRQCSLETLR